MTVWKITGKIIRIAITITCAQLQSAVLTILGVGRFLSFVLHISYTCLLYTSPSPRDRQKSRMPSSA